MLVKNFYIFHGTQNTSPHYPQPPELCICVYVYLFILFVFVVTYVYFLYYVCIAVLV